MLTRYLIVKILLFLWPITAAAQWTWTPAADHHAAVCKVSAGDKGGSGVLVRVDSTPFVLTAEHVVRGSRSARCTWPDGQTSTGETRTDKHGYDVGAILTAPDGIQPLELAPQATPGQAVELVGYGGPDRRLRHYAAQLLAANPLDTDGNPSSGDSGGPVLDTNHKVLSVISGGRGPDLDPGPWATYRGSSSPPQAIVYAFACRVARDTGCPQGLCPPNGGGGFGGLFIGDGGWRPERYYPPPSPEIPPANPPAQPAPPPNPATLEQLADLVIERMAGDTRFRGPVGPPGLPGRDGKNGVDGRDGRPGADATLTNPLFKIRKIDGPTRQIVEEIPIRVGESFDFLMFPQRD